MKITNLNKITIIGLGMMGGSLAAALKNKSFCGEISAYARDIETCKKALRLQIVDNASSDIIKAVENSDLIVMCLPISIIVEKSKEILPILKYESVVTDVGSTKKEIFDILTPLYKESNSYFIGSHPICGSEKKGLISANKNLYEKKLTVVCADNFTPQNLIEKVTDFWKFVGSDTIIQDPKIHDEILASTSHLPHLISSLLASTIFNKSQYEINEIANLCGTGFLDMTRLASGSSDIWKDILSTNNSNIIDQLTLFQDSIDDLKNLLSKNDESELESWLENASLSREQILTLCRFL